MTELAIRDLIPPAVIMRTHEQIIEDQKGFTVTMGGKTFDLSKDNFSDKEINRIIYILKSFKSKPKR